MNKSCKHCGCVPIPSKDICPECMLAEYNADVRDPFSDWDIERINENIDEYEIGDYEINY